MISKCRVCGSKNFKFVFESQNIHGRQLQSVEKFKNYYCNNCQAYFLGPVEEKPNYYRKYYLNNYYPKNSYLANILNFISFSIKKRTLLRFFQNKNNISILDIGCGRGEFLLSLPNKFQKYGVEINTISANIAEQQNLNIFNSDIYKVNFKGQKFDCITLWHVFEHLSDPSKLLKLTNSLLNINGILVLVTPNSDSIGFNLGKKNYFHLDTPRHLFIPNLKTFKTILQQNNFSLNTSYNMFYDFPLDLFWSLLNSPWKYIVYPLYPIIKLLSPETIMVIAKKNP